MTDDFFVCDCCKRPFFQGVEEKIMSELLKHEPQTGSQLARKIGVNPSSITKAVQRLTLKQPAPYLIVEPMPASPNVKLISINPDFIPVIHRG